MPEQDIIITPLTKEIVAAHVDALIAMSHQLKDDYWTLEHYLGELNRKWELSSAVYSDGSLQGFIIVSQKEASLHVHRIVIAEGLQGRGIGKQLIRKTADDALASAMPAVTLKAEADNNKTIGFYKDLGFIITGEQGALVLMTLNTAP